MHMVKRRSSPVVKGIVFVGIFCLLFSQFSQILFPKDSPTRYAFATSNEFYNLPKNSIDVLFVGASTFYRGINPLEMWESYGFTSYVRSFGSQAPVVSYYYIVEALQYQNPAVVVLDVSTRLHQGYDVDENEEQLRIAIDPMRLSNLKLKLGQEIVSRSEKQTVASYLFPLLRYHSRWEQLSESDFRYSSQEDVQTYKGFFEIRMKGKPQEVPEDYMQPTGERLEYSPDSLRDYKKILEFCEKNNIEVVLVTMPRLTWDYSRHLGVQSLADAYGATYMDYCLEENWEEASLDIQSDFRDENHLNFSGAHKVSRHLGAFLQENYALNDKRDDVSYQEWNLELQAFKYDLAAARAADSKIE